MGRNISFFLGAAALALSSLVLPSAWAAGAEKPAAQPPSAVPGFTRERLEDACTTEPRSEWLPEAEMRLLAEFRGYKIVTFKIAKGNCYEVYGFKGGQMVEAYFHPVTSKLVRQNVAK